MSEQVLKVTECPVCEKESTHPEWYEMSNDDYAVCPKCNNVVEYSEF